MKKAIAVIALAVALVFGSVAPANAHSGGQPHVHYSGCTATNCYTWMLENGSWHRGPFAVLSGQWGYVDTICSAKNNAWAGGLPPSPWGWYIYGANDTVERNFYENYGCTYPKINGYAWSLVG